MNRHPVSSALNEITAGADGIAAASLPVPHTTHRQSSPRLPPIERPTSLKLKLLYWLAPKEFGLVPTPFKVIYARIPGFILRHLRLLWYAEEKLSLDKRLIHLVQVLASRAAGDLFCADMFLFYGIRAKLERGLFDALAEYENHPAFDERDRAALSFAEESAKSGRASDETFARLRRAFGDVEIVELAFLVAVTRYMNTISVLLEIPSDDLTTRLLARLRSAA